MDKRNLAFDKVNFILLAIGMAIVILGFILMSGAGSNEHTFDTDIFSPYGYINWFLIYHLCCYSQAERQ